MPVDNQAKACNQARIPIDKSLHYRPRSTTSYGSARELPVTHPDLLTARAGVRLPPSPVLPTTDEALVGRPARSGPGVLIGRGGANLRIRAAVVLHVRHIRMRDAAISHNAHLARAALSGYHRCVLAGIPVLVSQTPQSGHAVWTRRINH
jgi:hypothetical protein